MGQQAVKLRISVSPDTVQTILSRIRAEGQGEEAKASQKQIVPPVRDIDIEARGASLIISGMYYSGGVGIATGRRPTGQYRIDEEPTPSPAEQVERKPGAVEETSEYPPVEVDLDKFVPQAIEHLDKFVPQVIEQLSLPQLNEVASKINTERARRVAPSLSPAVSELMIKINQGLPPNVQARLAQLIVKRQAESLASEEYRELLRLTDQVEAMQAERVEALAQLATLRGIPINTLMRDLGIPAPSYA